MHGSYGKAFLHSVLGGYTNLEAFVLCGGGLLYFTGNYVPVKYKAPEDAHSREAVICR